MSIEAGSELAGTQTADVSDPPRPLTEPELALLGAGVPLLIRHGKRSGMFNLYRMLRSPWDLSDASTFLGDSSTPGDHPAVALLLGMMIADDRDIARRTQRRTKIGTQGTWWPEAMYPTTTAG